MINKFTIDVMEGKTDNKKTEAFFVPKKIPIKTCSVLGSQKNAVHRTKFGLFIKSVKKRIYYRETCECARARASLLPPPHTTFDR